MAGKKENLRPCRDTETAKARGKLGGIASGESRRKHRLMSQIYADILAEQTGQKKGLSIEQVVKTILQEGGSPAVSMLREIRESTEGNKTILSNDSDNPVSFVININGAKPDN